MSAVNEKIFPYRYEEAAPIGRFVLSNLKRDMNLFSEFSSKFNENYVTETQTLIDNAESIVNSKSESLTLSMLYDQMVGAVKILPEPLNKVEGYLKLASKDLKITAKAFGVSALRKEINSKNFEGVADKLSLVTTNLNTYNLSLTNVGFNPEIANVLKAAEKSLRDSIQQRYEITSNRKRLVQSNVSTFNQLHERVTEILNIGKSLFKGTDPAKLADYTLSKLMKNVHILRTQTTDSASESKQQ
jgi:hypothetical protein